MIIKLRKSPNKKKKYRVTFNDGSHVDFGASGYSDYTKHKDEDRMKRYLIRHRKRENWTKSGIKTAGFWSRWLLWGKPTIKGSIKDIERRFDVTID